MAADRRQAALNQAVLLAAASVVTKTPAELETMILAGGDVAAQMKELAGNPLYGGIVKALRLLTPADAPAGIDMLLRILLPEHRLVVNRHRKWAEEQFRSMLEVLRQV